MFRLCSWARTRRWATSLGCTIVLILPNFLLGQRSANPPRRVLILYSFDNEEGIYAGFDRVLHSQLRLHVPDRVEFYTEYLDLVRFPALGHAQNTVRLLKMKYAQQRPDLIVPVSYSALEFLLGEGKDLFPGTPVVALFNERHVDELNQYKARDPQSSITGVASIDDPAGTLDFALRLQPDTAHVAVIVGCSQLEKYWLDQLKHDLAPFAGRAEIDYVTDFSFDELLQRVGALPPHSIILSTFFFQDAAGEFFLPEEVLDRIAQNAHAPIYSIYSSFIGHGVLGGRMTNPEITGKKVADLAAAVLKGERASSIPIVADAAPVDTVDWRQLQRWNIHPKQIPSGTVVLFREPSPWERYRTLVIGLFALVALEGILFVVLAANVRKRKRAEKQLRDEKALTDAVIEGLPGFFVLQDQTGKNIRWNKNVESAFREDPAQVCNLENVAEHDREAVRRARDVVLREGSAQIEADVLTQGGTSPYFLSAVRVDLEGKPYVAGVGLDLTQNRKTEQALHASEAALRSFVHHAPYGIATISVKEDRFLRANPAMVKLLGYKSESELQGVTISRDLYFDGDAQGFRAQPTRADFFSAVEFTWKRKDGKAVNVRASGRRIVQAMEKGDLIEIIAEDVTARRSLEEQLRHAQKLEALGQLSGSIAHDFNNLLSVIIGYSELLSSDASWEGPARANLLTIKKAGERAAALTAQLLAFSRRQVMQPAVITLNAIVRETESMLKRLMRPDIEQQILLEPGLWKTKCDPAQMLQVILNLAINARDAMPTGGILTLKTENIHFDDLVTVHDIDIPPGNYVKLSVTDTGVGMDEATCGRVFEPFFTTKSAGKGTGLGLATAYGIVKHTGGYIFADSELGKGATFSIFLPQFDSTEQPYTQPLPVTTTAHSNGSDTLLLVDDEIAFRDLLRDGLSAKGYTVLVAGNGVEALREADNHKGPIRLLITDVIMPQMSGPELVSALRKVRPQTDVLYMSGYVDDKTRDETASGELTLIQKPFYIDELLGKIQELLARK